MRFLHPEPAQYLHCIPCLFGAQLAGGTRMEASGEMVCSIVSACWRCAGATGSSRSGRSSRWPACPSRRAWRRFSRRVAFPAPIWSRSAPSMPCSRASIPASPRLMSSSPARRSPPTIRASSRGQRRRGGLAGLVGGHARRPLHTQPRAGLARPQGRLHRRLSQSRRRQRAQGPARVTFPADAACGSDR